MTARKEARPKKEQCLSVLCACLSIRPVSPYRGREAQGEWAAVGPALLLLAPVTHQPEGPRCQGSGHKRGYGDWVLPRAPPSPREDPVQPPFGEHFLFPTLSLDKRDLGYRRSHPKP